MLASKWMSTKVISIDEDESLSEAINTLKRNKIRRLPVLKGKKLVGMVSDRDLKEASPSKATSLDIWELHYLMSKIKVKDVMTKNPITIFPDTTIEKCAMFMHDNKIGGLPVINTDGKIVGIITESDVFEALINITGVRIPSYRISLVIPDSPGSIKEVCDHMRMQEFKCISILTTHQGVKNGNRELIIRFNVDDKGLTEILTSLKKNYHDVEFLSEKE